MSKVLITANIFNDALAPLIKIFDGLLVAIHSVVNSWGFAIVLMTLVIRAALIPLTLKQLQSTQRMREFAPEIKALQERNKDDRQKLNQEMMAFYRDNQINPFASCLPLLAQAPVFISLFYMLRSDLKVDICPSITTYAKNVVNKSVDSIACGQVPAFSYNGTSYPKPTGQEFLFIPDLTNKATGAVLVTLILLYVGSQVTSTLVMMTPAMDKTQRYIMFALPLFFVVFVINFPAGLLVYWITTNLWTVGQQFVVKRTMSKTDAAIAAAGAAGSVASPSPSSDKPKKSGGLMNRLLEASAAAQEEQAAKKAASSGSGGKSPKKKPEPKSSGAGTGSEQSAKQKGGPPPQKGKKKRTGRRK